MNVDILKEYPMTDAHGRRYREFSPSCREYAPTLVTSAGAVPAGAVVASPSQPEPVPVQRKDCPFKGGLYPRCTEDCTFYAGDRCQPGTAQTGKRCPLPAHLTCGNDCAMYHNSRCTIFAAERKQK